MKVMDLSGEDLEEKGPQHLHLTEREMRKEYAGMPKDMQDFLVGFAAGGGNVMSM